MARDNRGKEREICLTDECSKLKVNIILIIVKLLSQVRKNSKRFENLRLGSKARREPMKKRGIHDSM